MLFLDLDRFKLVNDTLGHDVGDQLLVAVARRLESAVRPGDTVARLGGDEFTILLDDVGDAREATADRRARAAALRTPFQLDGRELVVAASIGIALAEPTPRPDECCATPTSRCTARRPTARAATPCSTAACTSG